MANEITNHIIEELGRVRTAIIAGEPWFVGKDIAEALGYKNTKAAIIEHVSEGDRRVVCNSDAPNLNAPNRGLTAVNESGLFSLVLASQLPLAKKIERWVTHDVLPSINKTGNYVSRLAAMR